MRQLPGVVSFHVTLWAGRTVIRGPQDDQAIDRERGMDGWILNYTVSGRGRINRGAQRFTVEPGQLLLFKPLVAHDYHADQEQGRWTHLWVYFFPRPAWFDWLTWPEASPGILTLDLRASEHHETIRVLFERLVEVTTTTLMRRMPLAMSMLEQLLLWCDAANPAAHSGLDPRIQRAIDILHEHLERPIRLSSLAQSCGLSCSRLSHLFRAEVGVTPMQWLERHRLVRARELLLMTGRPIAEVATATGFENPIWFARVFRRAVGASPRAFRRQGSERFRDG